MNENTLIRQLYDLNESEIFYRDYQNAKKDKTKFKQFLDSINIDECLKKHIIIPEIKETMPTSMKDEYFFNQNDVGIIVQKHNCYSPNFVHYHNYFEGIYVYEGVCEHTINGKTEILKMGDFCLLPPGTSHQIYAEDQSIVIVMIITVPVIENTFKNPTYYKDNMLAEFFLKNVHFNSLHSYLMFHTGNDIELKQIIIQMMVENINRYQEYDAIMYAYFSIFFAKLVRLYIKTLEVNDDVHKDSAKLFEIVSYIQNHHADCTLKTIANRYHYTPEYTSKLIKESSGKSFSELLIEARVKQTINLLKSTNMSIGDIAYEVGYNNPESLIRVFKKMYNTTPAEYRKHLPLLTNN